MKSVLWTALILTAGITASAQSEQPMQTEVRRKSPTPEELKALPSAKREANLKDMSKERETQQGTTPEARMERLKEHQGAVEKRHQELPHNKGAGQPLTGREQRALAELEKRAASRKKVETDTQEMTAIDRL